MINCSSCGDWFHPKCCGLTQHQAKHIDNYTCPVCMAVGGRPDSLDPKGIAKLRRSRAPERSLFEALLREAQVRVLRISCPLPFAWGQTSSCGGACLE